MDPNERLTGLASFAKNALGPSGGGQPPMPPMGGGQPPMPPMGGPGMGEMAMEGQPPMEEPGMDLEQDSAMLAEAVVGRAQGDIGAAIAVLDNAKAMLMSAAEGGGQEPQMMKGGGYVDYKMNGGPLYAQSGRSLSDDDMLRGMIMDNLAQMAAAADTQTGRSLSDKDLKSYKTLLNQGQEGRSLSDKDSLMGNSLIGRSMSDKDSLMLSDAEKFSNLLKSMRERLDN